MPNLHPNLHPNVESSLQRSLLQPVRPSLSLMGSMCSCSRLCGTGKRSFTLSLFSSRGMQQTDGLMHCIENFACLHHLHGTILSACIPEPWATYSKQLIGHKFCVVCGGNLFVGDGVYPPPGGGGNCHLAMVPLGWGGTVVPGGWGDGHRGGGRTYIRTNMCE